MCGIVGMTSNEEFSVKQDLLAALKKLEYRGYDSSGVAIKDGTIEKEVGEIQVLLDKVPSSLTTSTGIAHTRWATHGGVTKKNAHPHITDNICLVHNGIIENYLKLRKDLEEKGYSFKTETDSEVIAIFLEDALKTESPMQAISKFIQVAKGTYGVVFFKKNEDILYAFKKDSPLCLGIAPGKLILASDIHAFSNITHKVVFFEDYDAAIITPDKFEFFNKEGPIDKEVVELELVETETTKKDFDHYMLKEIYEQPEASQRLIDSLKSTQKERANEIADMVRKSKRILFLACGTSYHAGLIGSYLLNRLGYESHAVIASEFEQFSLVDSSTLVIVVSQSGETMDVISVLKSIKKQNPKLVAIVNTPLSTLHRMSHNYLEMLAGKEVCVAATKSFTNSVICLYEIARILGNGINLEQIPGKIKQTIEDNEDFVKEISKKLKEKNDIFILGHKVTYPIAREVALKLKEISYVHAEGMMAGELKHGTIALVEPGVPVFGLVHESNKERMESSLQEVEARGADVYYVGVDSKQFAIPKSSEEEFSLLSTVIGQLLSYYIALYRKLPIDKPRNLAKSVTVK